MRPIGFADIEYVTRVLLAAPRDEAECIVAEICQRAHDADRYRSRFKAMHPKFGTGTLMSAVQNFQLHPRPPSFGKAELRALKRVVDGLLAQM